MLILSSTTPGRARLRGGEAINKTVPPKIPSLLPSNTTEQTAQQGRATPNWLPAWLNVPSKWLIRIKVLPVRLSVPPICRRRVRILSGTSIWKKKAWTHRRPSHCRRPFAPLRPVERLYKESVGAYCEIGTCLLERPGWRLTSCAVSACRFQSEDNHDSVWSAGERTHVAVDEFSWVESQSDLVGIQVLLEYLRDMLW